MQMGFDHPILFGMCIASILAPVHLVLGYRRDFAQRSFKTAIVGAVSFMSLSAGPLVSLMVQGFLLSCERTSTGDQDPVENSDRAFGLDQSGAATSCQTIFAKYRH